MRSAGTGPARPKARRGTPHAGAGRSQQPAGERRPAHRPPGHRGGGLTVTLRRAYDAPARDDGPRVLVDRVWPRGASRDRLKIVAWLKDLGPSTRLRTWFGHAPAKWAGFRKRYLTELAARRPLLDALAAQARGGRLTLVFGARDPVHNQAAVIKEVLERRGRYAPRGEHSRHPIQRSVAG